MAHFGELDQRHRQLLALLQRSWVGAHSIDVEFARPFGAQVDDAIRQQMRQHSAMGALPARLTQLYTALA